MNESEAKALADKLNNLLQEQNQNFEKLGQELKSNLKMNCTLN